MKAEQNVYEKAGFGLRRDGDPAPGEPDGWRGLPASYRKSAYDEYLNRSRQTRQKRKTERKKPRSWWRPNS